MVNGLVFGLSAGHKIGLAAVAGAFIVFALISAMVIPNRYPDFPGKGLKPFLLVTFAFTAATLLAVVFLAGEPKEKAEAGTTETTSTQPSTPPKVEGDPAAGKALFTGKAGCISCHTLKAANATGTVGPNLDDAKPEYDLIIDRVTNGKTPMPPFKGVLTDQEIKDVAAFVYTSTH